MSFRPRGRSPRRAAWLAAWICGSAWFAVAHGQQQVTPSAGDFTYAELHPYGHDEFSAGEGATGTLDELEDIADLQVAVGDTSGFDSPLGAFQSRTDALNDRIGLRLGSAVTALGAWAFGAGDDPSGSAWDFDLMSAWTLLGRGEPDTGTLVVSGEYRNRIGDDPASALGGQLGTLINPVNAFNDRRWVWRDAYWLQRFADNTVRVLFGRAAPDDYVGLQPMQNINALFVNRHFSANPTIPFPGHGPMIGVSVRPGDYYVTGGVASAYGATTESGWDTIDDGDYYYSAEAGFTPDVAGRGRGRYSVMAWYIDARDQGVNIPSDHGFTLVAGQSLTERLQVWGRYAYADATITNIRQVIQGGMGYAGLLGSPSNMTGAALSFARPRSNASRDETAFEVFQRLQLTRFTQVSAGGQLIFNPGNNQQDDLITVLYARIRIAF